MNEELKAQLERYMPMGVVVGLKDGKVHGMVEHSFAMDMDPKKVRIFWSGKAYSILGEHQLDGIKDAKYNARKPGEFVFDALAEDLPIEINWERWLEDLAKQPGDKFAKRNAPFMAKPGGEWQLRATLAEKELAELKPRYTNVCKRNDELDDKLEKLNEILNPPETQDED